MVSYDPVLGTQGLSLATQMLNSVAGPYKDMQTLFGIAGGTVNVVIAPLSGNDDGSGGAYHDGCDFTVGGVLYLDATFASTTVNPLNLEVRPYVAELSESFMGPQNRGWGCGFSNGEALSRFLFAEQEHQTVLSTHSRPAPRGIRPVARIGSVPPRRPIKTPSALDAGSFTFTGCAGLASRSRRSSKTGGATFTSNYKTLTGKTSAYQDLLAAVKNLSITSDNPFP